MPTTSNANGVQYALTPHGTFLNRTYTLVITYPTGSGTPPLTVNNIPGGNVLATNGTVNPIAALGSTSVYVIPPGVTNATVDVLVNVLGNVVVYVGGQAVINGLADVAGNTTINVDGGSATLASGIVASALSGTTINIDSNGTFGNTGELISALNGSTINFNTGGGTFVADAGNGVISLLNVTTINGFTNAADKIDFENLMDPVTNYTISGTGTQTITLYDGSTEVGTFSVTGSGFATGSYTVGVPGTPLTFTTGTGETTIAATPVTCFLAGTRILTANGDVAVEAINPGDVLLTADGRAVPVKWTGVRTVRATNAGTLPVCIQAGALGDNIPSRNLHVSPDHSLFIDGALVPAQLLVNGKSITQSQNAGLVNYYHVEVEPHDIIVAEGAPTESYLDTGNRETFNRGGVIALFADMEPKSWEDACAPILLAGEQLDAIRATLQQRAANFADHQGEISAVA